MAIIACKECAHQVSDQAASCPNCGAPVAAAAKPEPHGSRSGIWGVFITLVVLCLVGATLWLIVTPQELIGTISKLNRADTHSPAVIPTRVTSRSAPADQSPREPDSARRSVYQTTAEQLYQDYNANAVATQNRIGNSQIRITGSVAEIDEDASGHPVVKLWTSHDESAEMMLNDDQRGAAAALVKGQKVDIQCDKIQRDSMQRSVASPQGAGCALVSIDAVSKQSYLAVTLSSDKGSAPVYVVGPMSESACLTRADSISAQLGANLKRDHIVSRNCASTARESIPAEGCRLSSSMSAIPDLPTAHLWRYDCVQVTAAPRRTIETLTASRKSAPSMPAARDSGSEPASAPDARDARDQAAQATTPAIIAAAPAIAAAPVIAAAPAIAVTATAASAPPPVAVETASLKSTPVSTAAAAGDPASVQPQSPPVAATAAPERTEEAPAAPAVPSDLLTVSSTDPGAADHIASYCNKATAAASDRATVAAGCRHEEAAAWTRLVLHNEFPALDDATRRKCSEPPFPDSYVAKESCAKYLLRVN
jgi:hypothetical protein